MSSFPCLVFVLAAAFIELRGGLGKPGHTPTAEQQIQAGEALNQGEATRLFQRAKESDLTLLNARLYLATTFAVQYIPDAPSEDNRQFGHRVIREFKGVLQIDAGNLSAVEGIGSLLF